MAKKLTRELVEAADKLQDWHGLDKFGAIEVLAWWGKDGYAKIAMRGPALRIELHSFMHEMVDNRRNNLDISIQRALGLNARPWMQGSRVVGVQGGVGQTMDTPDAPFAQVMDTISSSVQGFLEERGVDAEVFTTMMPSEGSPWEWKDKKTPFYNAKTKKVEFTPKPDWVVNVEIQDPRTSQYVKAPGADFCKIAPVISADPDGPMACRFEDRDLDFMVTHSINLMRHGVGWRKVAKLVNHCGGLLYPSMAVSQVPGATFGPVCLVVNPMVALEGMKPYFKRRGQWPIITYTTDVWTEVTRDFLSNASALLFEQLTGQWEISIYGKPHFYTLGPPVRLDSPMHGAMVLNTKKLATALAKRTRIWHRDLTGEEVESMESTLDEERYPYLEAKSNGIVSVNALVACAAPTPMMRSVRAFLDAINFQGEIIPIRTSREEVNALTLGMDYGALYDYSWRVFDAVMKTAYDQRRVERIMT